MLRLSLTWRPVALDAYVSAAQGIGMLAVARLPCLCLVSGSHECLLSLVPQCIVISDGLVWCHAERAC